MVDTVYKVFCNAVSASGSTVGRLVQQEFLCTELLLCDCIKIFTNG